MKRTLPTVTQPGRTTEIVQALVDKNAYSVGAVKKRPDTLSKQRRCWLNCAWCSTWFIPSCCLARCGKMRQPDRQIAWREKVALCIIIFLLNAMTLFVITGLGLVLCPKKIHVPYSEPGALNSTQNALVRMYGSYYSVPHIFQEHVDFSYLDTRMYSKRFWQERFYGQDVSLLFPRQHRWQDYCSKSTPITLTSSDRIASERLS